MVASELIVLVIVWSSVTSRQFPADDLCSVSVIEVLTDVISYLRWLDAIFIYDDFFAMGQRQRLVANLGDAHIAAVSLPLKSPNDDAIAALMSSIKATAITTIAVFTSPNTTLQLVQYVNKLSMPQNNYYWIVVDTGLELDTVTAVFSRVPRNVAIVTPIVTSLANASSGVVTGAAKCRGNSLIQETKKTGATDFTLPHDFDICSFRFNTSALQHVASWKQGSGLRVFAGVIYPEVFHHFHHAKLRIAVWDAAPFTKRVEANFTELHYEGFCIAILKEIAEYLNFTYEFVEPPDQQWGALENGTWNGMVGMVMRGDADFAVGPFTITAAREEVVDFTVPYMEDGGSILTRGGDPEPDLLNVFRPFPPLVWLTMGAAIVLTIVILFLISRYHSSVWRQSTDLQQQLQQQRHSLLQQDINTWTLNECIMVILSSLLTQGAPRHPSSTSGRLVLGVWWLFSILVVSLYTASLASLLTVPSQGLVVDSIQDLAASSLLPVTIRGSSWWDFFMNADSGVYNMIGRRMAGTPKASVIAELLPLVYSGKAGLIVDVNQLSYIYGQDCKRLHLAKSLFNNNGLGFVVPKNAYFREAINRIILKLQEGGFLEAWKHQYWAASSECSPSLTGSARNDLGDAGKQLEMASVGGLLIVYSGFVGLSLLLLLAQRLLASPACRSLRNRCLPRPPDS